MTEFTEDEMVNRLIELARDQEQTEENLEGTVTGLNLFTGW